MRQAEHYIVGKTPPAPEDPVTFIGSVLSSLGWQLGAATAKLLIAEEVNEAKMYSRARVHQEAIGRHIYWARSRIEEFYGGARGILVCLLYQ